MRGDYDCDAAIDSREKRCRMEHKTVTATALKAIVATEGTENCLGGCPPSLASLP